MTTFEKIVYYLTAIVVFAIVTYYHIYWFMNPDKTQMRIFLDLWYLWVILAPFAGAIYWLQWSDYSRRRKRWEEEKSLR